MNIKTIYLKSDTKFSSYVMEWAEKAGIQVSDYDLKVEEHTADGMLLINENQDIEKDMYDVHTLFDKKHIPTQKIDLNGTMQVAISNFEMWARTYKCEKVLILGSDELMRNENLDRFFNSIGNIVTA